MKNSIIIGTLLAASAIIFSGCNARGSYTITHASNQNEFVVRNDISYRPVLEIGSKRISAVGRPGGDQHFLFSCKFKDTQSLNPNIFEGLSSDEISALCEAVYLVCKQGNADFLLDLQVSFHREKPRFGYCERSSVRCELSARPVKIIGYEKFERIEIMQKYIDLAKKNGFVEKLADGTERVQLEAVLEFMKFGEVRKVGDELIYFDREHLPVEK